ncbi:hypothetical protein AB0O64_32560 [Streptomyces sp. NPDC088341]|uniref:hypothetical protein n=1 Tax=Streptomyces sp. NPDC088341 TaxID=3154870 RepID=UPI0034473319
MNVTPASAAGLAGLYGRYSARLAAHTADRLAAVDADPIADVDDITQDVWMWAGQQRRLPDGWEALSLMADWLVQAAAKKQRDRPETAVGLRPSGTPVIPLPGLTELLSERRTHAAAVTPLAA